jgi:Tfp pilus assembly protein PilX
VELMKNTHFPSPRKGAALRRRAQRGVSMLFTLMAMVILGFGAVALTRSVDTGTLIMGNLSFRQDAVMASSAGAEQAVTWLAANQTTLDPVTNQPLLNSDVELKGYYASAIENLDPTGNRTSSTNPLPIVKWDSSCMGLDSTQYSTCTVKPVDGTAVNGNKVQWVITRLCDSVGVPTGTNLCIRPAVAATNNVRDRGELSGPRLTQGIAGPYYRIIVRVQGPRNTVSFTESLIHF